jgi:kynurenine formamidase
MGAARMVVDLTQPIEERMPVSVGFPRVMISRYLDRADGDVATVEILLVGLHTGTHVDAPMHFVDGGACVDELDPLALCGQAVVVDAAGDGRWQEMGPSELEAWEAFTGERIGAGDIVLVRSGHARHWKKLPEGSSYMTTPWPYISEAGARWLVERGIRALGVECPDPDCVDQRHLERATFPTHRILLSAGVLIIENLANLDLISSSRFEFRALALPIAGASGSPVRALAILPPDAVDG